MQTTEETQNKDIKIDITDLLFSDIATTMSEEYESYTNESITAVHEKIINPIRQINTHWGLEVEMLINDAICVGERFYFEKGLKIQKLIREMLD